MMMISGKVLEEAGLTLNRETLEMGETMDLPEITEMEETGKSLETTEITEKEEIQETEEILETPEETGTILSEEERISMIQRSGEIMEASEEEFPT